MTYRASGLRDRCENCAGVYRAALSREDGNDSVCGSHDLVFHFHSLKDKEDVALLNVLTVLEVDGENVKKLFSCNNKLNGFILMGEKIARAGIYTALIREQTDLATVDYDLLCRSPQLAAFAREKRFDILSKGGESA